ncbi:MAG: ABC transporter substrate-binding protein [Acidimicrobiia bacterium]|nr:ABC transporter substrate-binding protein [Acidimicrobiia bacterium]
MKRVLGSAAIALALVASACGTRVDDDEAARAQDATTTTAGDETGATTVSDGMFGTLESPCGPGDTSDYPDAPDIGVTADSITIGTISDPGGPRPGLNQGIFHAMEAFVDWCNGQGGINGRQLDLNLRDAAILEYGERVLDACDEDFALVGGLGVLDDTGAQEAVDCGLPNIPGAVVTPLAAGADLTWQPLPNPPDAYPVGPARWVAENYPDAITRGGTIYTQLPTTEMQRSKHIQAYETEGFEFIYDDSAAINETAWDPKIVAMRNADVGYFTLVSSYEEILLMLAALSRQQWTPDVIELETNFYNHAFPRQLQEQGLDPDEIDIYVRLTTWPFEEADERPVVRELLDLIESTESDYAGETELLGVQAFSAGLLFATAAQRVGPDLTREALQAELEAITSWDGGGLHGQSNPGERIPSTCFIMMKITADGFQRAYPLPDEDAEIYEAGNGMACPEDGRVTLPQYSGLGARRSE